MAAVSRVSVRPSATRSRAARRCAALRVRAAADAADETPAPAVATAVLAPAAAVGAAYAAISSGAISTDAIDAYLHSTAGFVFDLKDEIPAWVVHWFHAINMGIVLVAMGGYGTALGWKIRAGEGDEPTIGTPDTAAELHPKLMAAMGLFFAAGGQGGLLFTLLEGRGLLESPHAVSALGGLGLLGLQGVLGNVMKDDENLRTAHAFLGTSLMALFVVHAGLGIKLGLATMS